mmetsp:Transcript_71813/g.181193  ORF Transcript_71813/g.181193 Transcript_71813/m.181193 type:complete len:222 (+) Transcript_71813:1187-1852(+)
MVANVDDHLVGPCHLPNLVAHLLPELVRHCLQLVETLCPAPAEGFGAVVANAAHGGGLRGQGHLLCLEEGMHGPHRVDASVLWPVVETHNVPDLLSRISALAENAWARVQAQAEDTEMSLVISDPPLLLDLLRHATCQYRPSTITVDCLGCQTSMMPISHDQPCVWEIDPLLIKSILMAFCACHPEAFVLQAPAIASVPDVLRTRRPTHLLNLDDRRWHLQ